MYPVLSEALAREMITTKGTKVPISSPNTAIIYIYVYTLTIKVFVNISQYSKHMG